MGGQTSQAWIRPQVIVIVRGRQGEAVLAGCKVTGAVARL
jgi:hypothetical protein